MRPFLFDTAVFLYATGTEHRYREPCRAIVDRQGRGELAGEASVELVQEVLYVVRRRRDRDAALAQARAVIDLCRRIHAFERRDLELALSLAERYRPLDERDAVHAATALGRGLGVILSPDTDLDVIAGLERVDPADAAGVELLSHDDAD